MRGFALTVAAAVLLVVPVSGASAAAAAGGRARLATRWDRAAREASLQRARPGEGAILVRTLAGIPGLVVRADADLRDLRRAAPSAVVRGPRGVWRLSRTVWVTAGATLTVRAPAVRELRLTSRGRRYTSVVTRDGNLRFAGERGRKLLVRSWDVRRGTPDRRLDDGRGVVSARGRARLDATDTRFQELGFYVGRLSGVAVSALPGGVRASGSFRRSDFVRNYFGAYTFETRDIPWIGNRFLDNVVYGLDPHDDSDGFLVEDNLAAGNGRHGIIFSRLCDRNVIRHNVSERNGWHGIVLDDGKAGDGPSNGNVVVDNIVRDNGKVGISIDGSGDNRIARNRIEGQKIGIRLYGRAIGNTLTHNRIDGGGGVGILVNAPAAANAVVANRVLRTSTAVRIRAATGTIVSGNALLGSTSHGVSVVDTPGGRATATVVSDNVIAGHGSSPILAQGRGPEERGNRVTWDYPTTRDAARLLGWVVGPGIWLVILGVAILGPGLVGVGGARARMRALGGLAATGSVVAGIVLLAGGSSSGRGADRFGLRPPIDPRLATTERVDARARAVALRILSKEGHATHPTWYHDSQVARVGAELLVTWNAHGDVRVARLRRADLEILDKRRLNRRDLGGAVDSTGTDTDRHDVPSLVVDGSRRAHFVYGGGSIAARSSTAGLLTRTLARTSDLGTLSGEHTIDVRGGAAFDFETVVARGGMSHLIGQRGRGNTGALVELRLDRRGRWLPSRQLVSGGFRRDACVRDGRARGCNRFAIARMASGRDGSLYLVWGYSEASLGGKCQTDRGYCDNDMYYAVSHDDGATWRNASGAAKVDVHHAPIAHDDARFRVASGHVGLFKAVASDRHGPLLVGSVVDGERSRLVAWQMVKGRWRERLIARSGDGGVASWNGSLVLRHDPSGFTLWTPTGDRIFRFDSVDGGRWRRALAYRGAAWSLTGARAGARGREVLMWRGGQRDDRSEVMIGTFPAGR